MSLTEIEKQSGRGKCYSGGNLLSKTPGQDGILDCIDKMEGISLGQMSSVKLMDRMDTKYVLHSSRLPFILRQIVRYYKVMEINGMRDAFYNTVYYDYPDLQFFKNHVNGKLNRCKVRKRGYVESNLYFLEVKIKTNKGKTIKKRVKISGEEETFQEDAYSLVKQYAGSDLFLLFPVLNNEFKRITLVNNEMTERVTIDFDLRFFKTGNEESVFLPGLVILEVKQEKSGYSVIRGTLSAARIKKSGISKYCLGVALTDPRQKVNRMKIKLRKIKKIINNEHLIDCN